MNDKRPYKAPRRLWRGRWCILLQSPSLTTCSPRRFPPPWSVDKQEACFIGRDANGQALAYLYF